MTTATPVTYWSTTWTDDDGVQHEHWFDVVLTQYGGNASLWKLDPPFLDEHEYVLICDRGSLLSITSIEGEPDGLNVPTVIPILVEVFAANPDGSVQSMSTIREPISLNRGKDGIDIDQILSALGYEDSGLRQYIKADGTLTYGTPAQIAAWEAAKQPAPDELS